mmetsp:Transcript_24058/g.50767  ORF Transcript_24058/g.50767 Transcript_24058/m.50767 type:complete len:81 (+) Transcript_24058:895-1137(+)
MACFVWTNRKAVTRIRWIFHNLKNDKKSLLFPIQISPQKVKEILAASYMNINAYLSYIFPTVLYLHITPPSIIEEFKSGN